VYAGGYPQGGDDEPALTLPELQEKSIEELRDLATDYGIEADGLEHSDLVLKLLDAVPLAQGPQRDETVVGEVAGILEIVDEGFAFIRRHGVMPSPDDLYVSSSIVRRFGLRTGDRVVGQSRPPKDQERYWGLARVDTVNGIDRLAVAAHTSIRSSRSSPTRCSTWRSTPRISPSASSTSSPPSARASVA
jgi:transcription termination factor Rho